MIKFTRVRRLPGLIAAFSLVALAVAAVAIADNLLADGDGVAPVEDDSTLAFGPVPCNADTTLQVALAVNRNGNAGSTNVFKDGSTVTVSAAESASAVDVGFAGGDNTIAVPSSWGAAANNKKTSDPEFGPPGTVDVNPNGIVTANVTIHPTTTGLGSATITFTGTGVNSGNATINRADTIDVSWSVASCDTTPPYVNSVTANGSTPTNAASVSWTVQFSESVSGVDAADFSLQTSGISGASVTSVSPAGPASSYTVTASTGTGDGSIGLNVVDDNSIKDAANNPLGDSSGGVNGALMNQAPYTVDKTAPAITLSTDDTAAGTGWFNIASDTGNDGINVTASASDLRGVTALTCTRNTNGFILKTSDPATSPLSDTQALPSDGMHLVSCTASDGLGNTTAIGSEETDTYKVDLTAPAVSISSPTNGTTTIAPSITVNGAASDAAGGSGVGSVKVNGTNVSGSLTPSWSYSLALACGSNSITATATDVAGNGTSTSPAISVTRLCFGLQYLQPLDQSTSTPVMNMGKYGRTIPVKVILSLLGGGALDQAALNTYGLTLQMGVNGANCAYGTATDDVEAYADAGQSSAGSNLFRWDSIAGQWIYNLDTKAPPGMAMAIGSCYRLDAYISDGTNKVKVSTSTYALFKPVK